MEKIRGEVLECTSFSGESGSELLSMKDRMLAKCSQKKDGLKRRAVTTLLLSAIAIFLTGGCIRVNPEISLGFNTWVGYQTILLTERESLHEQAGLSVRINHFATLNDVQAAFEDGKVDVMFSSILEAIASRREATTSR